MKIRDYNFETWEYESKTTPKYRHTGHRLRIIVPFIYNTMVKINVWAIDGKWRWAINSEGDKIIYDSAEAAATEALKKLNEMLDFLKTITVEKVIGK